MDFVGRSGSQENVNEVSQPTVIPNQESLIADLLSMDIGPSPVAPTTHPASASVDLLGGGLDQLVSHI